MVRRAKVPPAPEDRVARGGYRLGHGGDHHCHLLTLVDLPFHQPSDMADAIENGDGGAAEFHHNLRHTCGLMLR